MSRRLGELFERLVDKAFPHTSNDLPYEPIESVVMTDQPEIKIFVDPRADVEKHFPSYKTEGAAGFDLTAFLPSGGSFELRPQERRTVFTGLSLVIPPGYEVQIRPRSGWAIERGITVLNSPGTIDCDYRGKLHVLLYNASSVPVNIQNGDRIAQAVCAPVARALLSPVSSIQIDETERGSGGFGSTGR